MRARHEPRQGGFMDFEYRIDPKAGLIFTRFQGKINVQGLIECLKKIYADPEFKRGMNSVNDLRSAVLDWEYEDFERFRAFVQSVEEMRGNCRWAIILTGGATYVSARIAMVIAQAHGLGIEARLFESDEDAIAWAKGN